MDARPRNKTMSRNGQQVLLRVYMKNTDHYRWFSAKDTLIDRALAYGLAGATVVQGFFGLDSSGELVEPHFWSVVQPAPVVVELIDEPDILDSFFSIVRQIAPGAVVTAQPVAGQRYCAPSKGGGDAEYGRDDGDCCCAGSAIPTASEALRAGPGELGQLMRVFTRGSDTFDGEPLYRAAILQAQELKLIWAAVMRASVGFGIAGHLRAAQWFQSRSELPLCIEFVDRWKNIEHLLRFFDTALEDGMITLEDVALRNEPYPRHLPQIAV